MKSLNNLKLICLLAFVFLVGCKAEKYDDNDPLASVYQTHWQGTLINGNSKMELTIVFQQKDWGACLYKDEKGDDVYTQFKYTRFDKVISIYENDIINGQWWIYKLTPSEMILKTDPYLEKISQTLTLNRIY